ncbi:TPA: tyrosine-type recombinase/integrase [Vibrio parahaemolyticus]|nr:tyrosine-type recombinase/integrase [Vibrio parahaemolyticus]
MGKLFDKHLKAVLNRNHKKTFVLSDGEGLGARISPLGAVQWQFRYYIDKKEKRLDLGRYPDVSLVKARELARQYREWLAEGYDPKSQRALSRKETLTPVTVKDALEYWLSEYAEENRANAEKHRSQFERHIYPYIGELPLAQTETYHWIECFDRIRKGVRGERRPAPVAAGYIMQNAKQALRFCRVRRYATSRALDDLTVSDVGKKQAKRDRILSDSELLDVWRYVNSDNNLEYYRDTLMLLMLLGARTQEVRLSQRSEWDLDAWLWTVPKLHSKSSVKITRPIPKGLRPWLQQRCHGMSGSEYLLKELKSPEAVSQFGRTLWKRLGHAESWTLHDLRRTLATRLNENGVMPHIVEQLLGHSLGGVMAVYNHSQYLPEKLSALDLWYERVWRLDNPEAEVLLITSS